MLLITSSTTKSYPINIADNTIQVKTLLHTHSDTGRHNYIYCRYLCAVMTSYQIHSLPEPVFDKKNVRKL